MQNKEKIIKFREYVENVKYVTFCDIEVVEFSCKNNWGITIYKKSKRCKQSIEDFLIQWLLIAGYDPQPRIIYELEKDKLSKFVYETIIDFQYASKEIVSVDDEKMTSLVQKIFNKEVGGKDIFTMVPINNKDINELKNNCFFSENMEDFIKEFGFDIDKLKSLYMLDEDFLQKTIYAEDDNYIYILDINTYTLF